MNFLKTTGALWILVVLVVGYAYVFEYKDKKEKLAQEIQEKKIFQVAQDDIQKIFISSLRGNLVLEKKDDEWSVTAPFLDVADKGTVQNFYNTISSESYEEVVDNGESDLKIFGLDNPMSIEIQTQKETKKLKIGTVLGLSGKKYLQIEGDPRVLLGSSNWDVLLNKDLQEYRKKDIFGIPEKNVKKVVLESKKGLLNVIRSSNSWDLEENQFKDLDKQALSSLMSSLLLLRANQVDLSPKTSKAIALKINIELEDGNKINVVCYEPESGLSRLEVSGRPVAFKISSALMDQFLKSPSDLRDRKVPFKFKKDEVYEIEFISPMNSFKVQKEELSWVWAGDGDQNILSAEVDRFLNKVAQIRVQSYYNQKPTFQESGKSVLVLKSKTQELLRLEVSSRAVSGSMIAKSSLIEELVGISSSDFVELSNINIKTPTEKQKVKK